MNNIIKEYIRDENYNPRGVVVAVKENDNVYYGYSLCNPCDKYNKELGFKIAIKRASAENGYNLPKVPMTRQLVLERFLSVEARALNYFKDIPKDNIKIDISKED